MVEGEGKSHNDLFTIFNTSSFFRSVVFIADFYVRPYKSPGYQQASIRKVVFFVNTKDLNLEKYAKMSIVIENIFHPSISVLFIIRLEEVLVYPKLSSAQPIWKKVAEITIKIEK